MILGGVMIDFVQNAPPVVLPYFGELYAWQTTFLAVGLPGILMALLLMTVREPVRQEKLVEVSQQQQENFIPFKEVIKYLFSHRRNYGPLFAGTTAMVCISYVYFSWAPTMITRSFDWSIKEVGLNYGFVLLVAGPLGIISGGWLGNRLYNKGIQNGHMWGALVGSLILVPSAIVTPLMPAAELAMVGLFFASMGPAFITANAVSRLMMITPNELRGQTYALFLTCLSIIGMVMGPTAVALITDYVYGDPALLRYSVALVSAIFGAITLFLFYRGLNTREDIPVHEELRSETQGAAG